jgi:hypothetical protein
VKIEQIYSAMIQKNGAKHQMTVAIEELAELTKELTKHIRDKGNVMRTCEEIADVEICLEQIKMMLPRSKTQIALFKRHKRRRLEVCYVEGAEK